MREIFASFLLCHNAFRSITGGTIHVHCKNTPKLSDYSYPKVGQTSFSESTFRDIDKNVAFDTQRRTNGILKVKIIHECCHLYKSF